MIHTEREYNATVKRIEELLQNPNNIENKEAEGYVELNILSDLVADKQKTIDLIVLMNFCKVEQKTNTNIACISSL